MGDRTFVIALDLEKKFVSVDGGLPIPISQTSERGNIRFKEDDRMIYGVIHRITGKMDMKRFTKTRARTSKYLQHDWPDEGELFTGTCKPAQKLF
jgi:hypothetical protein